MRHIVTKRSLNLLAKLASRTCLGYDELNPFRPQILINSYGRFLFDHGYILLARRWLKVLRYFGCGDLLLTNRAGKRWSDQRLVVASREYDRKATNPNGIARKTWRFKGGVCMAGDLSS